MTAELAPRSVDLPAVFAAWLAGKSERTRASYAKSLSVFAEFVGAPDAASAVGALLAGTRGDAARTVESFKGALLNRGLAAATVNFRIAAIASCVEAARRFGACEWTLDVDNVKPEPRRDSRGPREDDYEKLLAGTTSARDKAAILLMGDRGLRRAEVASLLLDDFKGDELFVLGKGRREREAVTLNERTKTALAAWIAERGRRPGPLFGVGVDALYEIVAAAGRRVGVVARPHGLRHTFGTRVAARSNGDAFLVQKLLRHKSVTTGARYVDRSQERADALLATTGKE